MKRPEEGLKRYLVGGAVRDMERGQAPKDNDWAVVGETPDSMVSRGFQPVGKDFPVFLHPETKDEYALARSERKTGRGYAGFQFDTSPNTTIEEDLERRDLTINAMALDVETGQLIDPYGGVEDIEVKTLRHVGDAFGEDPVRILRTARFHAKLPDFDVDPDTMTLMRGMVQNGEVDHLVPERVWQETQKALTEEAPQQYIQTLDDCGALEKIYPEIKRLQGGPQPIEHHPEKDSYIHTNMVLARAAQLTDNPRVRFAALVHDVGKGVTPEEEWPKHHGHEKAGVPIIKQMAKRLRIPNDYRELAEKVSEHHLKHHQALNLRAGKVVELLENVGALGNKDPEEKLEEFLVACQADAQGRGGAELTDTMPQGDFLREVAPALREIQGERFIEAGMAPGPDIGERVFQARAQRVAAMKGPLLDKQKKEKEEQDLFQNIELDLGEWENDPEEHAYER